MINFPEFELLADLQLKFALAFGLIFRLVALISTKYISILFFDLGLLGAKLLVEIFRLLFGFGIFLCCWLKRLFRLYSFIR